MRSQTYPVTYTWHEIHARSSLEEAIHQHGLLQAYTAIDLEREALWCRDAECRHHTDVPVVGQTHGSEGIEQLWSRAHIRALMCSGRVLQVHFRAVESPAGDHFAEENHKRLTEALAGEPLEIEVWSSAGGLDADGKIRWASPIPLRLPQENGTEDVLTLLPGSAPIEIGYTLPSRTMAHLTYDGAVWRWPYGSAGLWLLIAIGKTDDVVHLSPLNNDFDVNYVNPRRTSD